MNSLTHISVRTLQFSVPSTGPSAPHMYERIRPLCLPWDYRSKSRRVCALPRGIYRAVFSVNADLLCFEECLALSGNAQGSESG